MALTERKDQELLQIRVPAGEREGAIHIYFPGEGFQLCVIDIHAATIPKEASERKLPPGRVVKINVCEHGRCELRTFSGEYTYLVGGEVAVDTGQTQSHFYYPTSEYVGVELILFMDEALQEIPSLGKYASAIKGPDLPRLERQCRPMIFPGDETISSIVSLIHMYDELGMGGGMLLLKGLELLLWVGHRLPGEEGGPRRFYTRSQTEIARRCSELIRSDLKVRFTARELAERFGVSETSVKNYFRHVYGTGFLEYQNRLRMEEAMQKLSGSDESVGNIAHEVGFASQTCFAKAFQKYTGCLPLEYRRRKRIEREEAGIQALFLVTHKETRRGDC